MKLRQKIYQDKNVGFPIAILDCQNVFKPTLQE